VQQAALAVNTGQLGPTVPPNALFNSDGYKALPRQQKMNLLWNAIIASPIPIQQPNQVEFNAVFTQDVAQFFDTFGDAMPIDRKNGQIMLKLKHTQGLISKAQLIPVQNPAANPYTGILQQGADSCLVRLSSDEEPNLGINGGRVVAQTNGIAVKCLRDGTTSANMMGMFSAAGIIGETNFFARPAFSNIQFPQDKFGLQVQCKFI